MGGRTFKQGEQFSKEKAKELVAKFLSDLLREDVEVVEVEVEAGPHRKMDPMGIRVDTGYEKIIIVYNRE